MKNTIVIEALKNLKINTNIVGELKDNKETNIDGILCFKIGNETIEFATTVKKELRTIALPQIYTLKKHHKDLIVVAENIFPKIKEQLKQEGIAYLDTAGNIFLNKDKYFIFIENNKTNTISDKTTNRAFSKTGLKLVFHFLQNEKFITEKYRDLAQEFGIAIGNINYIIINLKQLGHIIEVDKTHLKLVEKEKLFRRWITIYDEKLKPSLFLGKYRFLKEEDYYNWQKIQLKGKTKWGGEPAADKFTNHLKASVLTIYTEEAPSDLIKNYRLIPDKNGNIEVYKRFWAYDEVNWEYVPPLLIYADLINTGDPRNIETAENIFNDVIKNKL